MNKINLAHIGLSELDGIATEIDFIDDDYLLDHDFIIASGISIIEDLEFLHREVDNDEALATFSKRQNDLKEFYHHGGTLVLLIDDSHIYPGMQGMPAFGNGKLIDIMSTRPAKINYAIQYGSNVQYHPLASCLATTVKMHFKAILNHTGPNTLLRTQRTLQPVSYHRKVSNGFFLALPHMSLLNPDNPNSPAEVFEQLATICQALKQPQPQLA